MLHYVHHESPDFNERQIMQIAHDMADGLRYLHAMGLIHGNLCPSNVLLVAPYVVFELTYTERNHLKINPRIQRRKLRTPTLEHRYKAVIASKGHSSSHSSNSSSNVINYLSRDDMMRCRAAWQAVVGANATKISLKDFPMAARAVDCTESEVEKILSSRST